MEYHSERFKDHSLLIFKKEKIVACLPANSVENILYSHQGLTYGGLLVSEKLKTAQFLAIFRGLLAHLEAEGLKELYLKQIPSFYTTQPSEEIDYALHLAKAECYRVDTASVIDYRSNIDISSNRLEGVKKGIKNQLKMEESKDFKLFWEEILVPNLKEKHQAQPTHSLTEIALLAKNFPKNIRQFNVFFKDTLVGGATIFETKTTAHVQYISAGEEKQELGTLDFLFHHLITDTFSRKRYFDFGISNENEGNYLNQGLSYWKECFGARSYVHRFYKIKTANHTLLNDVLL